MTTSSLILNALVCLAIAAVRARSSQNFLRASADTATKPFGAARVGDADHLGRRLRHRVVVVADDVAEQHHLRPAVALGLGRVADRLHVALVEMLETGQQHARGTRLGQRVEVVLDLDDRRRRVAHLPEEFEAHGADRRRHPVQDEARAGDEPVAAFLLDAGQPREELVGDVLAETGLAERARRESSASRGASPSCRRRANHAHSNVACAASWILPRLWSMRVTSSHCASAASPSATTRDCRAPCPTAPPSCRRRSSRRCRRCTTRRPTSDRTANTRPAPSAASITRLRDHAGAGVDRRRRSACGRAARCARPPTAARAFRC